MNTLETQSSLYLSDIADVTLENARSQQISDFMRRLHSDEWVAIAITARPETKCEVLVVVFFRDFMFPRYLP